MMLLSMSDSGWADALKIPLDTPSRHCTALTTFSLMLYAGTVTKKGTVLKKIIRNIKLQDYPVSTKFSLLPCKFKVLPKFSPYLPYKKQKIIYI